MVHGGCFTGSRAERKPEAVNIPDGIIELDSDAGKILGFTSDRFDGYLWRAGQSVSISFIQSYERGNFRALVARIHELGLRVDVPTPLGRMQSIVRRNNYSRRIVNDPALGAVEVWSLAPGSNNP